MTTRQIFLKQIESFIEEMCTIFPEIKSLQVFKQQYEMLKSVNSKVIIENFITYVIPHKNEIMAENEEFFKQGGGQEFIKGDLIKFRNTMSDIWNEKLSEENKKIAWKYFKVFVLLAEKYMKEQGQLS